MAPKYNAPIEIAVEDLLLDQKNPRVPLDKRSLEQDELAVYVAETYFGLAVGRSIASHNYFPSEPLIAVNEGKKYVVVEGNRRLAALKLLLHPEKREKLASRNEWDELGTSNVPTKVPVVVVHDRKDVAPIIGYRHISGIQPWDAHAKARYIADQIDGGLDFSAAAKEVGESEAAVKMSYRNYHIAEQAAKMKLPKETVQEMKDGFGIFTRAMQDANIRDYIGAPPPGKVEKKKLPIGAKKADALKEMVTFLFGSTGVLKDSRDITKLGKAVASEEGIKSLRKERNLEEALVVAGGVRDRLVNRLSAASRGLRAAIPDYPKYRKDQEVRDLIDECKKALEDLK